jgi:predicted transcriptional regulator
VIERTLEGRLRRKSRRRLFVCEHKAEPISSSDFASVLSALTSGPKTTTELETITGSETDIVREVIRVLTLTGHVARHDDSYALRQ